jgi:hypothetical protein
VGDGGDLAGPLLAGVALARSLLAVPRFEPGPDIVGRTQRVAQRGRAPRALRMMLSGLMSQWMRPIPWAEPLVRTFAVDILACSRVPGVDETSRAGQESFDHLLHPRHGGEGDRGAASVAQSRSAVLEEPRLASAGAR